MRQFFGPLMTSLFIVFFNFTYAEAQIPGPITPPVLNRCVNLAVAPVSRTPVEAGKKSYIWPDDQNQFASVDELTKKMDEGDTLYLRAGTTFGNIYTLPLPSIISNKPLKRIHVRGLGVGKSILQGFVWIGADSTLEDLTIKNPDSAKTSVQVNPAAVVINHLKIEGGLNALIVGNDNIATGPSSGKIYLNCLSTANNKFNGVVLGSHLSGKTNNVVLRDVFTNGTGNMGIEIYGDGANISNAGATNSGTWGISIEGHNSLIQNTSISNTKSIGLGIKGNNATIDNLTVNASSSWGIQLEGNNLNLKNSKVSNTNPLGVGLLGNNIVINNVSISNVGTSNNGTGIEVQEGSTGYHIFKSSFSNVRIGILLESKTNGVLDQLNFTNIYFKNILNNADTSPHPISPGSGF